MFLMRSIILIDEGFMRILFPSGRFKSFILMLSCLSVFFMRILLPFGRFKSFLFFILALSSPCLYAKTPPPAENPERQKYISHYEAVKNYKPPWAGGSRSFVMRL